jgi:hypothetical protein
VECASGVQKGLTRVRTECAVEYRCRSGSAHSNYQVSTWMPYTPYECSTWVLSASGCPLPGEPASSNLLADCCRHFAYCVPYTPGARAPINQVTNVIVSERINWAPQAVAEGILVHEMGHVVDFACFGSRYGHGKRLLCFNALIAAVHGLFQRLVGPWHLPPGFQCLKSCSLWLVSSNAAQAQVQTCEWSTDGPPAGRSTSHKFFRKQPGSAS